MKRNDSRDDSNHKLIFQCSDVGQRNDCDWQVGGKNEEELMRKIEEHGREKHNLTNSFDEEAIKKVRSVIRFRAAAQCEQIFET